MCACKWCAATAMCCRYANESVIVCKCEKPASLGSYDVGAASADAAAVE